MSQRNLLFLTFACIILVLALLSAFHFSTSSIRRTQLVDFIPEREYNAIIARYHDYDAVITGTSLSGCFKCSEVDKLFGVKSHKFIVSGAHCSEIVYTIQYALKYHKIKMVFCDLYLGGFSLKEPISPFPKERYQDWTFCTDLCDSLGIKALRDNVKYLKRKNNKNMEMTRDLLSNWEKDFPCSKKILAKSIFSSNPPEEFTYAKSDLQYVNPALENFWVPMIRNHPDVKFIFFFSPHHILYSMSVKDMQETRSKVMDHFLVFKNVELYDFNSVPEICCNNAIYKDVFHYNSTVNDWMLHQFKGKKYLVTRENRKEFEERFLQFQRSVDKKKIYADLKKFYDADKCKKK